MEFKDHKEHRMVRALRKHFEAQKEEALYNLDTYAQANAGIGEHGEVFKEILKQFAIYEAAMSNLQVLPEMAKELEIDGLQQDGIKDMLDMFRHMMPPEGEDTDSDDDNKS